MKKVLLIITILLSSFSSSYASHIPGGNVTWECTGNPNEFLMTVKVYLSCSGITSALPTSINASITNTCGLTNPALLLNLIPSTPGNPSPADVSQICKDDSSMCDGGSLPGVMEYTYQTIITLPDTCDSWNFVYSICCRDQSDNLTGTTSNTFYVNSQMNSGTAPCDASPYVTANAIPYVCAGVPQTYCPAAIDPDGDSLYYSLVSPMGATGTPIVHIGGYGATTPLQNLTFDPVTGCIVFNQPNLGNYVVTYKIEAFDAAGNQTGFIYHDFQVEVVNNPNCLPPVPLIGVTNHTGSGIVTGNNTIEICEGQNFCIDIEFSDLDVGDTLVIDSSNTNVFAAMPGATITLNYPYAPDSLNHLTLTVCWNVPVGASPNTQASVGVTDGSCPIENLATFPIIVNVINATVANPPIIICGPQTAQMTANGGSSFTWFYTATGTLVPVGPEFSCNPCANPIATPLISTNYYVVSNLSVGCNNTDSTSVTVVPDFMPTAYGDTLLCDFLTKQIGVNVTPPGAGYNYSWTNAGSLSNDTINNPIASPTQTTSYITTVTSPFGCVKEDTVIVSVNPPPSVTLVPGDTVLCQGETIQFDVSLTAVEDDFTGTFDPLVWSNVSGATVGTPCIPFNGTALNFNSANRELNTAAANVTSCTTIDFCMFVANSSSSGVGCENADLGEDIELNYSINGTTWINIATYLTGDWDAGGPYANSWQCFSIPIPPGAATANTMFQWKQIGFYGATIDNWALDDIAIMCGGNNNYSYQWNPATGLTNDTLNNPVATPTTTTAYTVTLTDTGGCSVDRTQTITIVPTYTITPTQTDTAVCLAQTVGFTVTESIAGAYNYSWSPAGIFNNATISNPTATFNTPGNNMIIVTVDNNGGCTKVDTLYVNVAAAVIPNITILTPDSLIDCGDSVLVDLDLGGGVPATCGASATNSCSGPATQLTAGTAVGANTSTSWPAPYGNFYKNAKHQFLFTAAELNTMGFNGGKITEIAWEITQINGTTAYNSYQISMGCTQTTNLTTWETGLTQVFNPATVNIMVGMNVHALDVAYEWDGISNLVIEICYDNLASAFTNNSITPWATTTFTSSIWYRSDATLACPTTTNSGTGTDRPITSFTWCPTIPDPANFTYNWTPNIDITTANIQNPQLHPSVPTTYLVTVMDITGSCFDTDSIAIDVQC
ncbi:MAG: hypothetical protein COB15_17410, partial [Flavobacteriales bacterium]